MKQAMDSKDFQREVIGKSLRDIIVELGDEFDQNFVRKSFFGKAWQRKHYDDGKGSLMIRSGALRRSISKPVINTHGVCFSSNLPYAGIHNSGGKITVTKKMIRYFWARYYEATGGLGYKIDGEKRNTKKNRQLNGEAAFYKAMALKRAGSQITIPQRQFIGDDPQIGKIVQEIVLQNINEFFKNSKLV